MACSNPKLKIIIVGESGVGKTSMLERFCGRPFCRSHHPTIGSSRVTKTVMSIGGPVELTVWDTAGRKRFYHLTASYYRAAEGVMFVYDATNPKSFEQLQRWVDQSNANAVSYIARMVVSNKMDKDNCLVDRQKGMEFAREIKATYVETSASSAEGGLEMAFLGLVGQIMTTYPPQPRDRSVAVVWPKKNDSDEAETGC